MLDFEMSAGISRAADERVGVELVEVREWEWAVDAEGEGKRGLEDEEVREERGGEKRVEDEPL